MRTKKRNDSEIMPARDGHPAINQTAADRQGSGTGVDGGAVSVATRPPVAVLFRRENSGASLYFGRTSQGRSVCGLASSPGGRGSEFSIFIVARCPGRIAFSVCRSPGGETVGTGTARSMRPAGSASGWERGRKMFRDSLCEMRDVCRPVIRAR